MVTVMSPLEWIVMVMVSIAHRHLLSALGCVERRIDVLPVRAKAETSIVPCNRRVSVLED